MPIKIILTTSVFCDTLCTVVLQTLVASKTLQVSISVAEVVALLIISTVTLHLAVWAVVVGVAADSKLQICLQPLSVPREYLCFRVWGERGEVTNLDEEIVNKSVVYELCLLIRLPDRVSCTNVQLNSSLEWLTRAVEQVIR